MNDIDVTFDWTNEIPRKYVCVHVCVDGLSRFYSIEWTIERESRQNSDHLISFVFLYCAYVHITAEALLCRSQLIAPFLIESTRHSKNPLHSFMSIDKTYKLDKYIDAKIRLILIQSMHFNNLENHQNHLQLVLLICVALFGCCSLKYMYEIILLLDGWWH